MTRKDYILIAKSLREDYNDACYLYGVEKANSPQKQYQSGVLDGITSAANVIANSLETDNPRFDRELFLAVVRGEKDLNSRPSRQR